MTDRNDDFQQKSATVGAPLRGDDPTADDPHFAGAPAEPGGAEPEPLDEREREAVEMAHRDPTGEQGPSYERDQGSPDAAPGGSTDPHNTLGHADSGEPV